MAGQAHYRRRTGHLQLWFKAEGLCQTVVLCRMDMLYYIGYDRLDSKYKSGDCYMEAYTGFASVYDIFMDDVPYEKWSGYLHRLLTKYGIGDGLVLDLGCGTGTMTELMSGLGYDMIGVDSSAEMLEAAMEKKIRSGKDILYLQQDMREFELYGTVRAIYSFCDSLNYMTEPKDLGRVFHWVHNYLDNGGIFMFDFNTEYKYRHILGNRTIAENRDNCSFIWDNYYHEKEQINEYELSLFIKDSELSQERQDIYRGYKEIHFQKAYSLEEMQSLLKSAGLRFIAAYDGETGKAWGEKSERIYVVASKNAE